MRCIIFLIRINLTVINVSSLGPLTLINLGKRLSGSLYGWFLEGMKKKVRGENRSIWSTLRVLSLKVRRVIERSRAVATSPEEVNYPIRREEIARFLNQWLRQVTLLKVNNLFP